jgi:sugar phosphate permease
MGISYQRLSRVAKWFSPSGQGRPTAAVGVALALFGILGLSIVGFGGMLDGHTAVLIAVRISAPAAVAMALAGWALVERAGRPPV